nr:CYTH domain-containing protein [uncultured Sellimonas sp.]
MEIERKYLVESCPLSLDEYPYHEMEQGYLNTSPVVRVRRSDDTYTLTYKSKGLMVREEYNLPLTKEAYEHLLGKVDGRVIQKRRYLIPAQNGLTIELDCFRGSLAPLMLAEVEFPSVEMADSFTPPSWFSEDVTFSSLYHNSTLSQLP